MHNDASTAHSSDHVNFSAPASLRKWPSLGNQRSGEAANPYLVLDGTLDECLRKLMAYAASTRHLYEIHTAPQPPMVREIMAGETVAELTRLQLFFEILTPTTISSPSSTPQRIDNLRHVASRGIIRNGSSATSMADPMAPCRRMRARRERGQWTKPRRRPDGP